MVATGGSTHSGNWRLHLPAYVHESVPVLYLSSWQAATNPMFSHAKPHSLNSVAPITHSHSPCTSPSNNLLQFVTTYLFV